MALFDGASAESTEKFIGTWCGDLLQIVDELPEKYEVINCCFAEIWHKTRLYYYAFGTDKDGYVLKNNAGERFLCVSYNIHQKRGPVMYVKVEEQEEGIEYVTEFMSKQDAEEVKAQNERANIEYAKNLKAKGISLDIISKVTGLPKEEIESLDIG